jgi:hypothetical protein
MQVTQLADDPSPIIHHLWDPTSQPQKAIASDGSLPAQGMCPRLFECWSSAGHTNPRLTSLAARPFPRPDSDESVAASRPIGSDYPQVLPGVTFENEGECERAEAIIEAKARQNSWLIRYRCFHSRKPPLWPIGPLRQRQQRVEGFAVAKTSRERVLPLDLGGYAYSERASSSAALAIIWRMEGASPLSRGRTRRRNVRLARSWLLAQARHTIGVLRISRCCVSRRQCR